MITMSVGPRSNQFCDGWSRRSFLQVGGVLGGLSLSRLLQAERAAGAGHSDRSVIMIYLPGGPPHQDMFDIKTQAPVEIRGEFQPIRTKVPGIHICQLLPRIASIADRVVLIRSVVGAKDRHESFQCLTGRLSDRQPAGGWPEMGAVLSKVMGPTDGRVPPFIGLSPQMRHRPYNNGRAGFLGPAHSAFQPNGDGREDLILGHIDVARFSDRRRLLGQMDRLRRQADQRTADGESSLQEQALGVLTSSRLADAFDLAQEPITMRERYGYARIKSRETRPRG
jgi:hypothetical protein